MRIACFCAAIGLTVEIAPTSSTPQPAVQPLIFAAYILPLIANFTLTTLIASRIWWMTRGTSEYLGNTVTGRKTNAAFKAAMIVIESGVLYFVAQLIYLTVFAIGNPAEFLMSLVVVQIYVRLSCRLIA